jgi:hypothetical protein
MTILGRNAFPVKGGSTLYLTDIVSQIVFDIVLYALVVQLNVNRNQIFIVVLINRIMPSEIGSDIVSNSQHRIRECYVFNLHILPMLGYV